MITESEWQTSVEDESEEIVERVVQEWDTDRLRREYRELAELAGSLAHEIKNPLSVIRLHMEMLQEDFGRETSPTSRRALQKVAIVNRQCVRLENLLKDFMRLASINALELRPSDLNQQVSEVLDFFETQCSQQKIEVVRYLDPELPRMMMDKPALQAALMNLVKNAIEAMPEEGQLVARTRTTRLGIALDLIDTGVGMNDTTMLKMFSAFFSTKDGGSGLGLPTAKRIIEAHRGVINVQSTVGRGTQFTLEFPTPKRVRFNQET
ncbi:MAG: two-component sensor histidine kinase [Planctomycetaceae bacterium]|nr:two-component sensor histidine kinase [Planctomycetaceae bacterium]